MSDGDRDCAGNCRQGRECDCYGGRPESMSWEMMAVALIFAGICCAWVYMLFGWIGG